MTFLEVAQAIDEAKVTAREAEATLLAAELEADARRLVYQQSLDNLSNLSTKLKDMLGVSVSKPSTDMKTLIQESKRITGRT